MAFATLPTLIVDQLEVTPGDVAWTTPPTAVQVTAANVPTLTITSENVSQLYQGLANTSLGNAALTVSSNKLTVSNIGSSGQDGVSIAMPNGVSGFDAKWQNVDAANTLPVGAYIKSTAIGTAGGIINGPLGTLTVTKLGTTNYQIAVDFSALGATTYNALAYHNGVLVGEVTNQPMNRMINVNHCSDSADAYSDPAHNVYTEYVSQDWNQSPCLMAFATLPTLIVDQLEVTPGDVAWTTPPTAVQVTAAQVPTLTITGENVTQLYQGLANTSLGNATLNVVSNQLVVGNIGSSGQDGVSIALGRAVSCSISLAPLVPVPVGGWLQADATGSLGGVSNHPVGTLRVTHDSTNADGYAVTADLSALGSPTERVEVWNNHTLVAAFAGHTGMVARMSSLPDVWGKLGPVTGLPPYYGCLVIYNPNPTNVWVNNIHYVGDEVRVLQEAGPAVDYLSDFTLTAGNAGAFNITQETMVGLPATFAGLANTPVGNATLNVQSNQLTVANLGSSGQDGVSITLGRAESCLMTLAPVPDPLAVGAWVQADATGSLGGATNHALGWLRVSHDSNSIDGYTVTSDLSALGSATERVEVWNQGIQVAVFTGQPTGIVARISSLPIDWGKLGPYHGGPVYGCLVIANPQPTNIWVNNIHYVGDEVRVLQEAGPAVDYLSGFTLTAGNAGAFNITKETMVGLPATFAGLANTPLGNATLNVQSNQLTVANLGSSGQDGVSVDLGRAVSCDFSWLPLDLNQPSPLGSWIQLDFTGSVLGVTNHSLGSARVTKVSAGAQGFSISADLTPLGSPTERIEVWGQGTLLAAFTGQPNGVVAFASSWPTGGGKAGRDSYPYILGCIIETWPFPTDIWVNGIHFVADQLFELQESPPNVNYLSAITVTASLIPEIDITQEAVVVLRPTLTATLSSGNVIITWLGGGVLQESTNLSTWSDLPGATTPYSTPAVSAKKFYRVRQ
jgi:hypothetical protein